MISRHICRFLFSSFIIYLGLLRQPKWGHLKDLHAAIKLCEPALVAVRSPQYIKLGPKQEVCIHFKIDEIVCHKQKLTYIYYANCFICSFAGKAYSFYILISLSYAFLLDAIGHSQNPIKYYIATVHFIVYSIMSQQDCSVACFIPIISCFIFILVIVSSIANVFLLSVM